MQDRYVQVGRPEAHYSAKGDRILKYSLEIYHSGLKEHKLISAPELEMVRTKAELLSVTFCDPGSSLLVTHLCHPFLGTPSVPICQGSL